MLRAVSWLATNLAAAVRTVGGPIGVVHRAFSPAASRKYFIGLAHRPERLPLQPDQQNEQPARCHSRNGAHGGDGQSVPSPAREMGMPELILWRSPLLIQYAPVQTTGLVFPGPYPHDHG
jgi:hypothetical protein